MSIKVEDTGGGDFKLVPEGTHLAICNMVVDLGLQESTYMGETKIKRQVYLRWELPHERLEWEQDGEKKEGPMVIGKVYTASLAETSNLRKHLENWRGRRFTDEELKGFDLLNVLGQGCQITVTHSESQGRTYANITGIAGWPKSTPRPQTTEVGILKYGPEDTEDLEKLPDWIQEKIKNQKQDEGIKRTDNPPPPESEADYGEVPF